MEFSALIPVVWLGYCSYMGGHSLRGLSNTICSNLTQQALAQTLVITRARRQHNIRLVSYVWISL